MLRVRDDETAEEPEPCDEREAQHHLVPGRVRVRVRVVRRSTTHYYHSGAAAVRQRCGSSSAAVVRQRCGSGAAAVWQRCGDGAAGDRTGDVTVVMERVSNVVVLVQFGGGGGVGVGVGVLLKVALGARERGVDDVAKVRLHADVQEAEHREHLVDGAVAQLVVQVVGDHKVLEALQQLHGKEEEDAARKLDVLRARVDPHRDEQPEERKAKRGLLVEAHLGS